MIFNPLDAKTWHDDPRDCVIPAHELRWHHADLDALLHNRRTSEERALQIGDSVTISNKSSQFFGDFGTVLFVHKDGALVRITMQEGNPLYDELHFHLDELTRRDVLALPPGAKGRDPALTEADLDNAFKALAEDERRVDHLLLPRGAADDLRAATSEYESSPFTTVLRGVRQFLDARGSVARDDAAAGELEAFLQCYERAYLAAQGETALMDSDILGEAVTWCAWAEQVLDEASDTP
jgi:hypothetical protein